MSATGVRAVRQHCIRLEGPPETVFPLFGPERESEWAAEWSPEFVTPCGDDPGGCVFWHRAHESDHQTTWYVADWDAEGRRVRYVVVCPERDVRIISIEVEGSGGTSEARIRYEYVGLTEAGSARIRELTAEHFAAWVGEWEQAINTYLRTGRRLEHDRTQG